MKSRNHRVILSGTTEQERCYNRVQGWGSQNRKATAPHPTKFKIYLLTRMAVEVGSSFCSTASHITHMLYKYTPTRHLFGSSLSIVMLSGQQGSSQMNKVPEPCCCPGFHTVLSPWTQPSAMCQAPGKVFLSRRFISLLLSNLDDKANFPKALPACHGRTNTF